ncbi:cytochrome P450 [Sodiomyces alkalinus F11]|uniref:Cytochrome P450 n=1 Tax=Sodiomyces alkalinus (strain CBS 110278 / VKM F-3762 / F11) TaxID=1314773 RepID=A0A3N2Q971_SODAK|nr:cytochrome P450 [Sodiomyces alkalinus F11]ROT43323.1 cytochrome P450 [Sodiomyces alkalinus F11]
MALVDGHILFACSFPLLLFLFWVLFGQSKLRRNGVVLRKPPNTWPLVGNGIVFLRERQKLFSWFAKCERLYGYETLQISVPSLPPGIIISDPRNLDYVFKNEGVFSKGDFVKKRSWDLFGHGIINADGEVWKVQRKAGLRFLNTTNLKVLTQTALPQYLQQSIDFLDTQAAAGSLVDLQAVFHEITTQLMGSMAYNMEMHADDNFSVAFDHASGVTAERFQNPLWFVTEVFFGSRFRRSVSIVKSYGAAMVANAVRDRRRIDSEAKPNESEHDGGRGLKQVEGSLIQSFLDAIGDESLVADAALNYLSAGRDTTAQVLTWTFYLLMRHPDVVAQIRTEVSRVIGADGQNIGSSFQLRPACLGDVAALPFTHAVFNEALRLYPPVPFEIKQSMEATTLPDGTFLPRDSVVVWCPWAMNRSRLTWGVASEDFQPQRWLDQSGSKVITRSASEFPVFNGGPRTCLGKRMAELMATQVIAVMVLKFDFIETDHGERVSKSSLTLPMKGGLPCRVKKRKGGQFL